MARHALMAAGLMILAAVPCAASGVIRGRILMPGQAADAGAATPAVMARAGHGPREAVVYLEQLPEKIERRLAKQARRIRHTIVQEHLRFVPRVTVVTVGDSVRIGNQDRVYHSSFSVSPARRFDLGKYPPGHFETLAFDTSGVVNLHCDIHPRMLGFVLVLKNHAYVRLDSTGRFQLPRIPQGTYTLSVWHPRLGMRSRIVEMPKRGNVDLELRL